MMHASAFSLRVLCKQRQQQTPVVLPLVGTRREHVIAPSTAHEQRTVLPALLLMLLPPDVPYALHAQLCNIH
jgi:hypothetical protein